MLEYREVRQHIFSREQEGRVPIPCELRMFWAAVFVIRTILGEEWFVRNVSPAEPDPYFAKTDGDHGTFRYQDRVVLLGELLLNLQRAPGFASQVKMLANDSLEAVIAQLEGAQVLLSRGIPMRFVEPSGVRGQDYDVEALFAGTAVACEVKAKLESTVASTESVVNTLKTARKQLPSGLPGLVFLKIPEEWAKSPESRAAVDAALEQQPSRVSAVVLFWEDWRRNSDGWVRATCARSQPNRRARYPLPGLRDALAVWPHEQSWASLEQIVCTQDDVLKSIAMGVALAAANWSANGGRGPRGAGYSWLGSLSDMTSRAAGDIVTAVVFESDDFDLLPNSVENLVASVELDRGPLRAFKVAREAGSSEFEIQIPGAWLDGELANRSGRTGSEPEHQAATLDRVHRVFEPPAGGTQGGGLLFRQLRDILSEMRNEGMLHHPQCALRKMAVAYVLVESRTPVFTVTYMNPITV